EGGGGRGGGRGGDGRGGSATHLGDHDGEGKEGEGEVGRRGDRAERNEHDPENQRAETADRHPDQVVIPCAHATPPPTRDGAGSGHLETGCEPGPDPRAPSLLHPAARFPATSILY